jgi:hypothetical protein
MVFPTSGADLAGIAGFAGSAAGGAAGSGAFAAGGALGSAGGWLSSGLGVDEHAMSTIELMKTRMAFFISFPFGQNQATKLSIRAQKFNPRFVGSIFIPRIEAACDSI